MSMIRVVLLVLCSCTSVFVMGYTPERVLAQDEVQVQKAQVQVIQGKPVKQQPAKPDASLDQAELDKKALESAGLKSEDTAGLLAYLKQRTLNDADAGKIASLIGKLGDESFDERVKAEADLERIGLPAIALLKQAASNDANGAEIVYRAKSCLKRLEKVPQAEVAGAVVRALARSSSPEVVPALLAYLPLSDSVSVTEEIQQSLMSNSVMDGKPEPLLVAALTDVNPIRRQTAAMVLVDGPAGKTNKELFAKVLALTKEEKDRDARFNMARSLLLSAREPASVAILLEIIPDLDRGQIWQLEDLLSQLAGADAPKVRFKKTRESLVEAQKGWQEWWAKSSGRIDLAKLDLKPRVRGRFLVITHDYRFGPQGVITEFNGNQKETWKLTGLMFPTDIAFTPNGRIWVADQNAMQVTERDLFGKVLSTRKFEVDNGGWKGPAQPIGLQLLDNGNIFITARNAVVEFDKTGKEVMKYTRTQQVAGWGNQDICSARKLQNGQYAISVMNNGPNGQNPQILFLDEAGKPVKTKDDKGKETDKVLKTGFVNNNGGTMIEVAKDRILVTENDRIAEYDLTTGKQVWTKAVNNPRCVQRLPNGNTLYVDSNYPPRAVEITPEGEEAWTYQTKDPQTQLFRVIIR